MLIELSQLFFLFINDILFLKKICQMLKKFVNIGMKKIYSETNSLNNLILKEYKTIVNTKKISFRK